MATIARAGGAILMSGDVSLTAILHPRLTLAERPSKACIDLDNCVKVICDALQGICYENDRQLQHISLTRGAAIKGGGITVEIVPA